MNNSARLITLSVILMLTGSPTVQANPLPKDLQDLHNQIESLHAELVSESKVDFKKWEAEIDDNPKLQEMFKLSEQFEEKAKKRGLPLHVYPDCPLVD